jgi:hypothetical protein
VSAVGFNQREVGVYFVRKDYDAGSPNTLFIGQMSSGDPGLIASGKHVELADDQYITIIHDFPVTADFPRIQWDGTSGTFFKRYDLAYATQNETAVPAPVNMGPHQAGWIDSGTGVLASAWTASVTGWLATDAVSSYAWSIASTNGGSASVSAGSVITSAVTWDLSPGHYWVELTVTLNSGAVMTGHRSVWAFGDDGVDEYYPVDILPPSADTRDRNGRRMAIETVDKISTTDIPEGTLCLYFEDASWGGSDVPEATRQCVGFPVNLSGNVMAGFSPASFEMVTPLHQKALKAFSQQLTVAADPANWQEAVAEICHLPFYVFYILLWHAQGLLQLFDYVYPDWMTDTPAPFVSQPGTLGNQVNEQAKRLHAWVGMQSDGTVTLAEDYDYMTAARQASEAVRMTLTESLLADVGNGQVANPARDIAPRVSDATVYGFAYTNGQANQASAHIAIGPGKSVGYGGSSSAKLEGLLLDTSDPQTDANRRAGVLYARENNPFPDIPLNTGVNMDVFEPARGDLVQVNVADTYWPFGAFNETTLVNKVSVTHLENGVKAVRLNVGMAVAGVVGEELPVPSTGNETPLPPLPGWNDDGLPIVDFFPPPWSSPPPETVIPRLGGAIAWTNKDILYCENIYVDNPVWTKVYTSKGVNSANHYLTALIRLDSPGLTTPGGAIYCWIIEGDDDAGSPVGEVGYWLNLDLLGNGNFIQYSTERDARTIIPDWQDYTRALVFDWVNDSRGGSVDSFVDLIEGTTVTEAYEFSYGAIRANGIDTLNFYPGFFVGVDINDIVYADAWTGGSTALFDWSGVGGKPVNTDVEMLRVPYRRWLDNALNNVLSGIDVAIAYKPDANGRLLLATVDISTPTAPSVVTYADRTPNIGGTLYVPDHGASEFGLDQRGGNSNDMVAACIEAGGSARLQVVSHNAGQNWTSIGSDDVYHCQWTGADSFWFAGTDGLFQYANDGAVKYNRTGNFFDVSDGTYVAGFKLIA